MPVLGPLFLQIVQIRWSVLFVSVGKQILKINPIAGRFVRDYGAANWRCFCITGRRCLWAKPSAITSKGKWNVDDLPYRYTFSYVFLRVPDNLTHLRAFHTSTSSGNLICFMCVEDIPNLKVAVACRWRDSSFMYLCWTKWFVIQGPVAINAIAWKLRDEIGVDCTWDVAILTSFTNTWQMQIHQSYCFGIWESKLRW